MFCQHCGKEIMDEAEICPHCGCRVKNDAILTNDDGYKIARFLLTFFFSFIGSFIINHTSLKPRGWKSRTLAYFFLGFITLGIYDLVACIFNFAFDPAKGSNIGYFKD